MQERWEHVYEVMVFPKCITYSQVIILFPLPLRAISGPFSTKLNRNATMKMPPLPTSLKLHTQRR